ncbi:hypothetical protein SAURM35S_00007 [Streptomyces aurantiogriseus]
MERATSMHRRREEFEAEVVRLPRQGLRVLAVAEVTCTPGCAAGRHRLAGARWTSPRRGSRGLCLLGLLGLADRCRSRGRVCAVAVGAAPK